ncbi:MAG: type II toxin-antitoxin system VapC family toxin [Prosthecobacter sp.]|nr:type II toxin-antitoxin system VapC family toxin [Prosthecobacter sp.]
MKLLLDTCAVLWLADEPEKLGTSAQPAIQAHRDALYVSAISAFEIGVKYRKGKLTLGMTPEAWWQRVVRDKNLQVLPITDTVALASTALPGLHADPCDRIIIATAEGLDASIVTSDQHITHYPSATVVW